MIRVPQVVAYGAGELGSSSILTIAIGTDLSSKHLSKSWLEGEFLHFDLIWVRFSEI